MENQNFCHPNCIDHDQYRKLKVSLHIFVYVYNKKVSQNLLPSLLFTIRCAIIIVICRGAGKYACAGSCNTELLFPLGDSPTEVLRSK